MGQAKRRGTFEQRAAQAIERDAEKASRRVTRQRRRNPSMLVAHLAMMAAITR
jgi:hypothetical protein